MDLDRVVSGQRTRFLTWSSLAVPGSVQGFYSVWVNQIDECESERSLKTKPISGLSSSAATATTALAESPVWI